MENTRQDVRGHLEYTERGYETAKQVGGPEKKRRILLA